MTATPGASAAASPGAARAASTTAAGTAGTPYAAGATASVESPVMPRLRDATLVAIDMQVAFAEPTSDWAIPRYDDVAERIAQLASSFGDRVVWTQFVRDADETGAWTDYYDRWSSFRVPADANEWNITLETRPAHPIVAMPTFSKWGPELAEHAPIDAPLVVGGVATDCCVLSTVLGAIDAGRSVVVVTDACGAVSDEAQQQTLALLGLLSPMVTLATTAEVLAARAQ